MDIETLIASRYAILAEAGQGPITTVFRAVDVTNGYTVALKRFPSQFSADARFAIRFREHLRLVAALDHPNLLPILDYGLDEDGRYFIAEAWAEGLNLTTYLAEYGPLSPEVAVAVARRICAALGAIHARGLLHRDLKPENVFLLPTGAVRIADVGFGELVSESGLSRTSVMLDGIAYLSPEQARGEPAEPASDVYSVGILLFEMLTGEPPFQSNDIWAVVSMHASADPPLAHERNLEVPPELSAVVARALTKQSAERYPNIAAFDAALAALPHAKEFAFPVGPEARRSKLALLPSGLSARLSAMPAGDLAGLLLLDFLVTFAVAYLVLYYFAG